MPCAVDLGLQARTCEFLNAVCFYSPHLFSSLLERHDVRTPALNLLLTHADELASLHPSEATEGLDNLLDLLTSMEESRPRSCLVAVPKLEVRGRGLCTFFPPRASRKGGCEP